MFSLLKESQGRNLLELFVPDKPNHILVRLVPGQCTVYNPVIRFFTLATKEIVSVISSDPPSKNYNVRFTRVPFKSLQLSMITYELHIICFVNCTFLVQKKYINYHYPIYKT